MRTDAGPGEKMGGETHGVGWGQRNYHPGISGILHFVIVICVSDGLKVVTSDISAFH